MTWHEKLSDMILKLGAKINPDGSIEMTFEQHQQLQETIKKEFHMSFAELLKELGVPPDAGMVLKNSGIINPKDKTGLKLSRHGIMGYVLSTENPKTDFFVKLWLNDCLKNDTPQLSNNKSYNNK